MTRRPSMVSWRDGEVLARCRGLLHDLTTITLDVNYRSSGHVILGVANAIAADAPEGILLSPLAKWYRSPARASRLLVHCADERDQSESVANRVLEFLRTTALPCRNRRCCFERRTTAATSRLNSLGDGSPSSMYGGLRYSKRRT